MTARPTIVWLRDDLRVADNPALTAAVGRGEPLVVVYILDESSPGIRQLGGATRWWLHYSLAALSESIEQLGGQLVLRRGPAASEVQRLVEETGATAVYWNRRYAASRDIDAGLKVVLRERDLEVRSFHANLLFEPGTVVNGSGEPYRVFTPFWKACLAAGAPREPLPAPAGLSSVRVVSDDLDAWGLLPTTPDWAGGLRARWTPGEANAGRILERFVANILPDYHRRDEPGHESTSNLSPHLRFGEISPFQVWHRAIATGEKNTAKFLSEVGWREFNWHILYHWPKLAEENFRPEFDSFPWGQPGEAELSAWQHGHTGIPLVDAGMRELWQTGHMHNRVRMVVASFLVKNMLVDWRVGERWFWDTLVDADEASNPGNWQWVAGSGADAAPYFRIFNPLLQAEKFDPQREYIDTWLPPEELATAPILDLQETRRIALAAHEAMKNEPRS